MPVTFDVVEMKCVILTVDGDENHVMIVREYRERFEIVHINELP